MDLLKTMLANRKSAPVVVDPPRRTSKGGRKGPTKAERAKDHTPGTKEMKAFIIEEKPSQKIVRDHLQAICDAECASSSDED